MSQRVDAFAEVLALIDTEIARYKENGQTWKDLDLLETLRAKVKALCDSTPTV